MASHPQLDQHIDRADADDSPSELRTDLRTCLRGQRPDGHRPSTSRTGRNADHDRIDPYRSGTDTPDRNALERDSPNAARPEAGFDHDPRFSTSTSDGARSDGARSEAAQPQVAQPEVARPEVARPEVARPEVARPEAVRPASDGPRFQLRLLDGFVLERAGRAVSMPHSLCRVVAFLGVRGRCGRAEVAGTLWPEVTEARAQASLRTVLWRLNQLEATLVTGREALALSDGVEVDVREFVACARDALRDGAAPLPPSRLTALSLTGELLPGWYEDWVLFERERLRQLQMHALEAVAEQLTQAKRHSEAIEAAMVAVRLEPLRESANRALISAHLAENNVVEAVRKFESFRDELTQELGVEPTPELERLVQSSLDGPG